MREECLSGRACTKQRGRLTRHAGSAAWMPSETGAMRRVQAQESGASTSPGDPARLCGARTRHGGGGGGTRRSWRRPPAPHSGRARGGSPALVERGVRHVRPAVAVPATVRSLRLDEGLRERVETTIAAQADVETGLQSTAVLRRAAPDAPVDATLVDLREPTRARHPLERLLGSRDRARMARPGAEVDERQKTPEHPTPLPVRVDAVAPRERVTSSSRTE